MKKYFFIIIVATVFCCGQGVFAQVTIGDETKTPAPYSLLQLEKTNQTGGLRLPRLTQTECNSLQTLLNGKSAAQKAAANGLLVYNTTAAVIQYWDGAAWAVFTGQSEILGENGVVTSSNVTGPQLGGSLNKATTVTLANNNLSFPFLGATDKVSVTNASGDKTFVVTNGKVGIGTESPLASLDINNSDPALKGLNMSGIGEQIDYLLGSDAAGNGTWQPLKPLSSIISGSLNNAVGFSSTADSPVNITLSPLRLTKGKWLVVANYTGYISNDDFYAYIHLFKGPSSTLSTHTTDVSRAGSLPALSTDPGGGFGSHQYATPQIFYFANVTANEEYYSVKVSTSSSGASTSGAYGGSYFFALRIDN